MPVLTLSQIESLCADALKHAGMFQRISAKRFNLTEGEYRHDGLLHSALIVSKTYAACRTVAGPFG